MVERRLLGLAQVVEHGAGGATAGESPSPKPKPSSVASRNACTAVAVRLFAAKRPIRPDEPVPDAPHRLEKLRRGGMILDITAEAHDEVVDCARVGVLAQAPHVFEDRASARPRLPGVLHAGNAAGPHSISVSVIGHVADPELQRREVERAAAQTGWPSRRRRYSRGWRDGHLRRRCLDGPCPAAPAQQPAHARQEDGQLERLRHVIVGAGLEGAEHLSRLLRPRASA